MFKPLRPCKHHGCNELTDKGYCDKHIEQHKRKDNENRMTAHQRGYTNVWSKASKLFLKNHPWCVECMKVNRYEAATETDHVIPHKGDKILFWDKNNWQGLCHQCHSKKTASEDGGFGNVRR